MPGPYAHITLLHELMRPGSLESLFFPSTAYHTALVEYFPYCALGAVSPDYPNLARADSYAARWADVMHCTRSCEFFESFSPESYSELANEVMNKNDEKAKS